MKAQFLHARKQLFDQLANQHWAYSDNVIDHDLHKRLYEYSNRAQSKERFKAARIGYQHNPEAIDSIRGDTISWLDENDPESSIVEFLQWAHELRLELNAMFYTGLKSKEFHFARYAVGQGYTTHMDQHRGNPHRRISLVLYLNRSWNHEDAGELCLYSPKNPNLEIHRILPQPGRLVLFRSDVFPHAVLPANKARLSLSGWFRSDDRHSLLSQGRI